MEQRKRVTASMTTFNGSVPALCQRMKPAMPSSRHAATNGLNVEDDMKIQEFMRWHNNRVKKGRRDIPVKNLRHIIPTFILRCFAMKEDQPSQKKVKGLWDRPPNSWNPNVPFLDPNNKGDQGKPKKEVLMMMFEYLITEYQKTGNTAMDLTKGPIQESEILMEPEHTDEGKPVEVADDIDSYDWNPLEDCKQRITLKLPYTQSDRRLSNGEIGVLNVAKDVLFRLFDLLGKKESLLHAHDFECTLDIVKDTGVLPPDHNQKWREFEVEGKNLDIASCPQTLEKQQLLSDENIRELGISTQHNPLVSGRTDDFSSIVSFRENLGQFICFENDIISTCKKGAENENKFAIADAIITEDKKPLNPDETAKFTGSQLQLLEDTGFDGFFGMFDEDNSGDLLDANPAPDLTDYFTKDVDWMEDIGPLEMAGNDSLMKEGKLCEDVHTPSLDHCVPLADDTNAGFVNNDDISVYQRERHNSVESIDSDHSYVQKSEIASEYRSGMSTLLSPTSNVCSQVAMLRISSPSLDTAEYMERGTKRGYLDAGNHLEPKHRRTEDMDIDRDGGEQPTYEGELSTLVEFM